MFGVGGTTLPIRLIHAQQLTHNGYRHEQRHDARQQGDGRALTEAEWKIVNKDEDQTLELDKWLTIARQRFNAADCQ
jgi:hypothetical protein